jgi:hypothetical protein
MRVRVGGLGIVGVEAEVGSSEGCAGVGWEGVDIARGKRIVRSSNEIEWEIWCGERDVGRWIWDDVRL